MRVFVRQFFALAGAFALASILSGCGGLGNANASNDANAQIESINGVRDARAYQSYAGLVASIVGNINALPAGIQTDGNLFFSVATSGTTTTISFFSDMAGTMPVGTIVVTDPADTSSYPQTYTAVVNVTTGPKPATGNITVMIASPGNETITGNLVLGSGATQSTVAINVALVNGSGTGSLTATNGGTTITISNISLTTTAGVTTVNANVNLTPPNVNAGLTLTINADGSGSLILSDGTSGNWNAAGSGSVNFAAGGSVDVIDFDNGD